MTAGLTVWLSAADAAPLWGRCVDRTRRAFAHKRVHAHREKDCRSEQWFAHAVVVLAARSGADLPTQISACPWCAKDPDCPPPPRLAGSARRSRTP